MTILTDLVNKILAAAVLVAEVGAAAYLALLVWLLSGWMVDDSAAFRMTPRDWYVEGLRRFAMAVVVGVVFAAIAYLLNRRLVVRRLAVTPRLGLLVAVILASLIVLAGAAGAISFVITRPFM